MVITRIQPMSLAKLSALVYAVFGLLIGAIMSLFAIGGAMFLPRDEGGMFGMIFGAAAIVILPVVYGALGFISAFVGALLYNVAAGVVGGVDLEVN